MKLVVIKNNFQVLLVPNYRDLRYFVFATVLGIIRVPLTNANGDVS